MPHLARTPSLLSTRRFSDDRGWFSETFSQRFVIAAGIDLAFVQDNQSFSLAPGTIRGIHFQRPPHAQAKLVRCVRGSIIDYAVDLRHGSPTFGKVVSAKLTHENSLQMYIPIGYGHAFVTLEPNVEVAYKVSDIYSPDCDGGIAWDDPTIGIDWPLPPTGAVLSEKDKRHPTLDTFNSPFVYDGAPADLKHFDGHRA